MNNVLGIIYAYQSHADLGELCARRTPAALPFCGRYRIVDFALSSLMHAGIFNVDIVMQHGFMSLMDHLRSGRSWNMVRHTGGMHLLLAPPDRGAYGGDMEALTAAHTRLRDDIKEEYILLTRGDLCASIDINDLVEAHLASGADVTAVCYATAPDGEYYVFRPGNDGFAAELLCGQHDVSRGVASLETYILKREKLLEMIEWCAEGNRLHFHGDGLIHMMREGGWRVGLYMHKGYARFINSALDYYTANMDMLDPAKLAQLFPADRYVATRARSDVSTYHSDTAKVTDSLVADGCIIEGTVERCILFRGVTVEPGAVLRDCIVLNDTVVGAGSTLKNVIADKEVNLSPGLSLAGSAKLPLVIPKGTKL